MLRHKLPLHVSTMREMSELLIAEQPELDRLQQNILNMVQEFHVLTATTKTLNHWEDFLGLERKPSWEVQRRRERCYSRLVAGGNMTSDALKELIEQVGGVECEIDEDATNLTISVRFTGQYGVPTYIDDIKIEVEKVRPYHIPITYVYLYPLVREYYGMTINEMGAYTLNEIINGDPLSEVS